MVSRAHEVLKKAAAEACVAYNELKSCGGAKLTFQVVLCLTKYEKLNGRMVYLTEEIQYPSPNLKRHGNRNEFRAWNDVINEVHGQGSTGCNGEVPTMPIPTNRVWKKGLSLFRQLVVELCQYMWNKPGRWLQPLAHGMRMSWGSLYVRHCAWGG